MNFEKIRIIILSLLCVCCISYCRTSANAEELLNYSEEYRREIMAAVVMYGKLNIIV